MSRTLISDDGSYRVYEVRDADGTVIGTDVEPVVAQEPVQPVIVDPADLAAARKAVSAATTVAGLRAALAGLIDTLNPNTP